LVKIAQNCSKLPLLPRGKEYSRLGRFDPMRVLRVHFELLIISLVAKYVKAEEPLDKAGFLVLNKGS
jgi:CxxC motif-containing protein